MPYMQMREERIKRNWTQAYVAKETNLTITSISDIENGKAKPSYSVLCILEDIFEMSHRDLLRPLD